MPDYEPTEAEVDGECMRMMVVMAQQTGNSRAQVRAVAASSLLRIHAAVQAEREACAQWHEGEAKRHEQRANKFADMGNPGAEASEMRFRTLHVMSAHAIRSRSEKGEK